MDILNFISWIKAGKYSPTMPAGAITVIGVPNPKRGDAYLPVTVPVFAFGIFVTLSDAGTTTHESLVNDGTGPTLATKGIKAGVGITLSSTANDITITNSNISNATNIGKLLGGGIVVGEWDENGVKTALVASLETLGTSQLIPNPLCINGIGTALSPSDGFTNTNELILATGAPADLTYAAGIARLHNGGGFTDWYLPSIWELNMCYNSAAIVNRVLGSTNGFPFDSPAYWSSTENVTGVGWKLFFFDGTRSTASNCVAFRVRAVRIHNL